MHGLFYSLAASRFHLWALSKTAFCESHFSVSAVNA